MRGLAPLAALSLLVAAGDARAVAVLEADGDIDLSGMWLFHAGDNLAFASPTLDDRAWELRRLPTAGTRWSERWSDYGWYRLHLPVALEATHVTLYLAVDNAREAAEIYVNGELIARRGRFGSRPRGGARILHLGGIVRAGLLEPGDNVVALRIYDPSWSGGVPSGRMLMGPAELVLPRVEAEGRFALTLRIGLAMLALFLGLAQLLTLFGRRVSRENWWLLGAGVSLCIMHTAGTGVFSWFLPSLDLATRLPIVGGAVGVLCLGSFFAARYDDWGARHVRIGRLVLLALAAFLFLAWERVIFYAAEPILLLTGLVASMYAAHLLSKAARRREQRKLPVFFSVALL
ncbi:MAG: hypothetical protein V3T05_06570, partial [Myxococcota bacterium]